MIYRSTFILLGILNVLWIEVFNVREWSVFCGILILCSVENRAIGEGKFNKYEKTTKRVCSFKIDSTNLSSNFPKAEFKWRNLNNALGVNVFAHFLVRTQFGCYNGLICDFSSVKFANLRVIFYALCRLFAPRNSIVLILFSVKLEQLHNGS